MNLSIIFAVGIGGFIGAVLRLIISSFIQSSTNILFPFGTLVVNILGSFLIGFLFLYFQELNLSAHQKALLITGLFGALTTFSTFSLETLLMIEDNLWVKALSNIGLNVVLCLIATYLGMMIFKRIYGL